MNKFFCVLIASLASIVSSAQDSYLDSIQDYQDRYVNTHELIKGKSRDHLRFFPPNEDYRVTARVQLIDEAPWFNMETSGNEKKLHRVFAVLHFKVKDTTLKLHIYQSKSLMTVEKFANLLFIPFTDQTSGEETYENGRYIDLAIPELQSGAFLLDFNKAYNPYCAYVTGKYSCPLPPRENDLPMAIRAGEMKFR